jgi:hypothetical protein
MDYETLSNCFIGVFQHYKTEETKIFVCGLMRNDIEELLEFFETNRKENQWHISFNGLAFDAQITNYIIKHGTQFSKWGGAQIAKAIYTKAQDCINRQTNKEFQEWSEKQLAIKQIDLFKLNHWDNPAKRSSLKWIQCSMDWNNVQDMPLHHTTTISSEEQIKDIIKYCINDVESTKAIMHLCKDQIGLRGALTEEYGISLYSASEPRISKELFLHFLQKETGISKYELRDGRTYRKEIHVNDILLPYLKFDVPEFKDLLSKFKNLVLDAENLKGSLKYNVKYRGVPVDFGLGGVHGAKRGIYIPKEGMTIMSSDVVSYYPNLAIRNGWSPAHLPSDNFCKLYEWFFDERKKIPKSNPKNYVYKIILNSTYGLSNDKHSFLFDPEFTMRITINGQLTLMMLFTMLSERIPGAIPIMTNTDGVEIMIPDQCKDQYMEICKEWESLTNLKLEHDEYQKLIVPDVNNYIGIFKFNEVSKTDFIKLQGSNPEALFKKEGDKFYFAATKCKGRFDFKNLALHKNKSFQVIPKTLYNYFVHGTDPKKHIYKNRNIFDFCGQTKTNRNWKFINIGVEKGIPYNNDIQKTLRYYVSKSGSKIIKHNVQDDREINVVSGKWMQTIFNLYEEKYWSDYNIDYQFYLQRIDKEIKAMRPELFINQMSLF